jgi:diguanylate cyclase (GGDEF)-like protein
MTGAIICFFMSLMLGVQAQQQKAYRLPLSLLTAGLLAGASAIVTAVLSDGVSLPMAKIVANSLGTLSYIFAMGCLVLLYKPNSSLRTPAALAFISMLGSFLCPDALTSYIWNQSCRIGLMGYATWLIAGTEDPDARELRWLVLFITAGSAIGMVPQLFSVLNQTPEEMIALLNRGQNASVGQSIMWAISPSLVYACVTSIIYARISKQLRDFAYLDMLTGAHSRRFLIEEGSKRIDDQRAYKPTSANGLLLLDIDHFKQINDTWGHLVGDAVLKHCVKSIKQVIRQSDAIVGRYGGEEFCVVIPQISAPEAAAIAERLREHIASTPYQHGTQTIPFTVSVGVTFQGEQATLNSLLAQADKRLYRAKAGGRNAVVAA